MPLNRQNDSLHKIDGFVQDCRNSIANALELLQYSTKPAKSCVYICVMDDDCGTLFSKILWP